MTTSFQLVGIDHQPFQNLFDLSDEQLKLLAIKRCFAEQSTGYPCRISLEDAQMGDELLLLPYFHQNEESPYRASGPIFIRKGVTKQFLPVGEISNYVARRLMSVRAYDANHMIVDASVCDGVVVSSEIEAYFRNDKIAYIHLHNAKRGCFSCQVIRI